MTWGIVMMEYQFFCNIRSYVNDPFSEPVKDAFIKKTWLTVCLGGNNSVWKIPLLSKSKSAYRLKTSSATTKSVNNVSIGV